MSASPVRQHGPTARQVADDVEIENLWQQVTDSGVHPRVALRLLVIRAQRLTGADGCAIALTDTARGRIKCQASLGSAPPVGADLDVSTGLSGHCVRTGAGVVCNDTAADPRVDPEACRALNLKSALIVPVKEGLAVVGLVEVFASRVAAFDAEHVRVIGQIAQIATTIRRYLVDSASAQRNVECEQSELIAPADRPMPSPEPTSHADAGIDTLVFRLRNDTLAVVDDDSDVAGVDVMDVNDELPDIEAKRRAMRLALLSLAAVGAIAIALGFYIAMNPAHRLLGGSAPSVPPVVRATPSEVLPDTDSTFDDNSSSKRDAAPRRSRDNRSAAASPQSTETVSVEAPGSSTDAVTLSSPGPISTSTPPEEVSPPALNMSEASVKFSEVLPPPAFPTLSAPVPVQPRSVANSGHLEQARLLRKVNPVYPPAAFAAGISGTVILQARIAADGHVGHIDVLRGSGLFTSAAVGAVWTWKYKPAELDGRPVESVIVITINFSRSDPNAAYSTR